MTHPKTERSFSIHSIASTVKETLVEVAKFRWIIFVITHFAVFAVNVVGSSLSLTIVAMIEHPKLSNLTFFPNSNDSDIIMVPLVNETSADGKFIHVDWTGSEKSRMLQAFFWGSMVTSVIGGRLGEIYGPRLVIALSLLSTGILNLIYPVTALHSFAWAYIIRVIQGISVGVVSPSSFVIVSRWSTQYERTFSNAVVGSGLVLANIIAHPLAGELVSSSFLGGWPSVFYILGVLNLSMVIPWYIFVYDNPEEHPYLSSEELEVILTRRSLRSGKMPEVPWTKMFTSLPVYGCLVVPFCYGWLLAVVATQIPSFYEDVLKLSHEANGFMAALPWVTSMLSSLLGSFLADKIRKMERYSLASIRKSFTFIGVSGASFWLILVTFAGGSNSTLIAILIAICKGMGTLSVAGSGANHLDISPTFAGTIAGFQTMLMALSALVANETAARMIGNDPSEQKWYNFFYLTSAINFIGAVLFCLLASGNVQTWDPSYGRRPSTKSVRNHPSEKFDHHESSTVHHLETISENLQFESETVPTKP